MELAKKIEQLYMDKCAEFKEEWRVIQINNKELEDDTIRRIEERLGRKLTNDEKMKVIKYCKDNSVKFAYFKLTMSRITVAISKIACLSRNRQENRCFYAKQSHPSKSLG